MTNELEYFLALEEIAKNYDPPEKLRADAERRYGLSYEECLEMAYENIQSVAAAVIKGKRRPKS